MVLAIALALTALGLWILDENWRLGTLILTLSSSGALLYIDVLVRKFKSRPRKLLTSITTGIKLYAELWNIARASAPKNMNAARRDDTSVALVAVDITEAIVRSGGQRWG